MHRFAFVFAIAAFVSCTSTSNDTWDYRGMFGRWDVTVHGENSYPLWFELTGDRGALGGRLQPRGGHALAFERVEASGDTLSMTVGETSYEGVFDGDTWKGTGSRGETSFEWTAVRAPVLAAPDNPTWGEPIELFNGEDLTGWVLLPGGENQWRAEDGVLVNEESGANFRTKESFDDFKLHIEVNVPEHSNSGIYLRGRHEIQVQDDHGKEPHNRNMGGVYGQVTPTSNPALPAGEWQSFDITLLGRCVTVELNGETIIDHQEIPGITGGALDANEGDPGPIYLQGDHGRILYRNIVLTPAS